MMVISSLVLTYAAECTLSNMNAYAFYAKRHSSLHDVRNTVNRINYELLDIRTGDITDISPTSISYVDTDGNNSNFHLGVLGDSLAVFRLDKPLVNRLDTFTIHYYDNAGNELIADPANISDIKRIGLSLVTQPIDGEGSISITTTVVPRYFLGYNNYLQGIE